MNALLESPEVLDTPPTAELEPDGGGYLKMDLPAIVDAAGFIAEAMPEPTQLIQGILHRGSKLVLGGGSKSFKTWTLADLALSVSHERPFLGFETTQGRVLYVNFEIQPWSWQKRLNAVAKAKGITIRQGALSLLNLRGYAANFHILLPQIRERVKDEFSLIVLDPIYKLYGGTDENSARDVAQLLNGVENLAVSSGAAVVFGAHFSKGNQSSKESIDRVSGSGVFARDPDSLLIFTRHESEDCFTVESTLRNFPPVAPFVARWSYPLMQRDGTLDPARLKQTAGRRKEHDPRKMLRAIADTTAENPTSISAWGVAAGIPRQTLTDYLPEMRRMGWIATTGEGSSARQYLTDNGRLYLKGGV